MCAVYWAKRLLAAFALAGFVGLGACATAGVDSEIRDTYHIASYVPGPEVRIDRSLDRPGIYRTAERVIYLQDEKYMGTEVEAHERLHYYVQVKAIPHERLVQALTGYLEAR